MGAPAGLHLDYLSLAEYRSARWSDVLGVATFDPAPRDGGDSTDIPVAQVATRVLLGTADVREVWRSGEPAESGQRNRVHFRRSENLLFGCIAVPEAAVPEARCDGAAPGTAGAPSALHGATVGAYRDIYATLDAVGYPHLLRVWNYLPDINLDSHGSERYRQFNSARQAALRAAGKPLTGNVPAASALGASHGSPLLVYFLAGRTPPVYIENPRQLSAYRYPHQYGPHSPVFSRATLLRQRGSLTLFISGTASIVGHRSIHVGDTAAQTRETLANIEALVEEANRVERAARFTLGSLALKVYVRRPADLPAVQAQLAAAPDPSQPVIYLQADICRQDLLVEIEATGMCPLKTAA
jgi:enamine deaminase RidA (YjgF/YER057c/UK114 family)